MTSNTLLDKIRHGGAIRWLLLSVSIGFVLVVLFSVLRIGFVIGLYNYFAQWVTVHLGFDYYLANLAGVLMAAVMTLILPSILWYIVAGRKKPQAIAAICGSLGIICILIYTVGQDVYFNRTTGEPLRYYVDKANGQRSFSFTPGFDPETGQKFEPYTSEIAAKNGKTSYPVKSEVKPGSAVKFSEAVYSDLNYSGYSFRIQPIEISNTASGNNEASDYLWLKVSICNNSDRGTYMYGPKFVYTQTSVQNSLTFDSNRIEFEIKECKVISVIGNQENYKFSKPMGSLHITDSKSLLDTIDLSDYEENDITIY